MISSSEIYLLMLICFGVSFVFGSSNCGNVFLWLPSFLRGLWWLAFRSFASHNCVVYFHPFFLSGIALSTCKVLLPITFNIALHTVCFDSFCWVCTDWLRGQDWGWCGWVGERLNAVQWGGGIESYVSEWSSRKQLTKYVCLKHAFDW